jgi:hypothetical protein
MKGFCAALFFCLLLSGTSSQGQDTLGLFSPSPTLHKKRLTSVIVTESVGYTGLMVGLYQMWYKPYLGSNFNFFNDNDEWLQVDKIGHGVTAYYVGLAGMDALRWSGVENRKAIIYGGSLGLIFQTSLEVFDGFSSEWGFSTGDALANIGGTSALIGQEFLWDEQRIKLKFSVHQTEYALYRPSVFGSNVSERFFKDYNGQTYWLSGNISTFLKEESKFPKWINVAVGYGADGLTGGSFNPPFDDEGYTIPDFPRQRQYYLSFDIDLTRIPTKSGFLKTVFKTFGFLKIPAPTLEFNDGGGMIDPSVKFHFLYF